MKRKIRYRSVSSPKRGIVWHGKNIGVKPIIEQTSLDDLVAASRIVEAQKKGLNASIKTDSIKATIVASRVTGHNKAGRKVHCISERTLNRIIIGKNYIENMPSEEIKTKYLKLIESK